MSASNFKPSSAVPLGHLFTYNSKFEEWYAIASSYERETLWMNLQKFLSQDVINSIQGIKEKLGDASSKHKLVSTLSELRIAVAFAFAERGLEAILIPDNSRSGEWRKSSSPPDLSLADGNCGFKSYVEVTRWAPDETRVMIREELLPIVEKHGLILRYALSKALSTLVVDYNQRSVREKAVKDFVQEFEEFVSDLDKATLPLRTKIQDVELEIQQSEKGEGGISSWNTSATIVPVGAYSKQLYDRLLEKSLKPIKWQPSQQEIPYFIALEVEQEVGQHMNLSNVLYGESTFVGFMAKDERRAAVVSYPQIVEERLSTQWQEFLLRLGYDSTRLSHIGHSISCCICRYTKA